MGTQYGTLSEHEEQEMKMDELKRRIWTDRLRLWSLKKQQRDLSTASAAEKQPVQQAAEVSRLKKNARAHDSILKYMLKMMDSCKAQGFVYSFIPENGWPVSGSSDNLRPWWKKKMKVDIDGPAALSEVLR